MPGYARDRDMLTLVDFPSADGTRLAGRYWATERPSPGIVIVHGLDSRKENHADFAATCRNVGMAALTIDLRGHGASGGELGPGVVEDVVAAIAFLHAQGHRPIGLRGSSLGGLLALIAAADNPHVACVVAICPAHPEALAQRLAANWPRRYRLSEAVRRNDGIARGYWHATGDERVPWGATFALAMRTPQPRQLRIILGGSHTSLQHDPAIQVETREFLRQHLS